MAASQFATTMRWIHEILLGRIPRLVRATRFGWPMCSGAADVEVGRESSSWRNGVYTENLTHPEVQSDLVRADHARSLSEAGRLDHSHFVQVFLPGRFR